MNSVPGLLNSSRFRGCLIAFEGIDGSGKTEQCNRLSTNLQKENFSVLQTLEPTKTLAIGKLIKQVLYHELGVSDAALALLFAADRADHTISKILPALKRGAVIISDRSVFSSLAYQGKGMSTYFETKWLETINQYACAPDLVFFLDIPAEKGLERLTKGQKRIQDHSFFENILQQEKIRSEYHRIFNFSSTNKKLTEFGNIPLKIPYKDILNTSTKKNSIIYCIDGTHQIEEIEKTIIAITINYLKQKAVPKKIFKSNNNSSILKYTEINNKMK